MPSLTYCCGRFLGFSDGTRGGSILLRYSKMVLCKTLILPHQFSSHRPVGLDTLSFYSFGGGNLSEVFEEL